MKTILVAFILMIVSGSVVARSVICDRDPSGMNAYKVVFDVQPHDRSRVSVTNESMPVIDSADYVCEDRDSGLICSNVKAQGPVITLTYLPGYPKPFATIVFKKHKVNRVGCR